MLKKILLMIFLPFFLSVPVFGADPRAPIPSADGYQTCLLQAVHESFNLNEDKADKLLTQAIGLDPDNPTAYALDAMLHLFAYEMCFTTEQQQKEKNAIFRYSQEAIVRGEKRIARFPKDSQAYLAMALGKVAKVFWAFKEKRYLTMAQETSNVWNDLEAAKAADRTHYDVDFPMGLLHYHIDQYRGPAGALSAWLITEGNRTQGLAEMQTAAQKGYLLRDIARSQLALVYQFYEKQPDKALPILEALCKKYPDNYNFYLNYGLALSEMGRFEEAQAVAAAFEKNMKAGKPPYAPELQPRYDYLMGRIHFAKSEFGRSESFLHKAIADQAFYNLRTRAKALLYIGMIHDIRRERKYAEDYYQRVLDINGADLMTRQEASRYLKTAYRPAGS